MRIPPTASALFCTLLAALVITQQVPAQEKRKPKAPKGGSVKMEDLPGTVVDTINREEPGLTPGKISKNQGRAKEGQPAKVTYNITGTIGDTQVQMTISEDGTVTRKSKQMPADSLPPLVASGAMNAAKPNDFTVTGAKVTTMRGEDVYEVQATAGGLTYAISMNAQGEVIFLRASAAKAKAKKGKGDAKRKKPGKKRKQGDDAGVPQW